MTRLHLKAVALSLLIGFTSNSYGQNTTLKEAKVVVEEDVVLIDVGQKPKKRGKALGLRVSTLGLGLEYLYALSNSFHFRLGVNQFQREQTIDDTDVSFNANIDFSSAGVIFDYHPFGSVFRISVGAFNNANQFRLTAKPNSNGTTYTFNGVSYPVTDVGSVTGEVTFDTFAPYFGIGFGGTPSGKGLALALDIGALSTSPSAKLTLNNCQNTIATICSQVASNIKAEQDDLQKEFDDIKIWPVVAFGLSYKF